MNHLRPKHNIVGRTIWLLACLVWPLTPIARAQIPTQSPADLVKFLTRRSEPGVGVTFSCGIDDEKRAAHAAAMALVRQGAQARPAIERALDLIDRGGLQAVNLYWLLYAYARIQGRSAFPRLWGVSTDPALCESLGLLPASSIALAFDLTSYVPDTCPVRRVFHCWGQQPRDALNQFILAWEKNDRVARKHFRPRRGSGIGVLAQWENLGSYAR
jgi:hypothetical protein